MRDAGETKPSLFIKKKQTRRRTVATGLAYRLDNITRRIVTNSHLHRWRRQASRYKPTWYGDSAPQGSLIIFCIVSTDLFPSVADIRVKRRASIDHQLVVCNLHFLLPPPPPRPYTTNCPAGLIDSSGKPKQIMSIF
ncbi:unnamed protein product [Clavelina lepadiformis]|uniref:Uncharacterized protein n=1 Tax=Clavelina lepadiformis TaxID=159417 RepID=A0ABP0FB76_CLALP